jgi:zinc protease
VVKEEYRFRVLSPPYGRLFNAIPVHSYAKHPYRRPGIGSIAELDASTLEDVVRFHSTFYRPDNATLIVVGDFEQQQLDRWVDQYFTHVAKPESAIPRVNVAEPARAEEQRFTEYAPNVPLPAVALTWLAPAAAQADATALFVAATVLSEGQSSRLQEKLVRGEIAVETFSDADLREDLGLFSSVAILGSDHQPAEAEKVIREQIALLAEKGVAAAELEKAKNLIVTSALRERETSNGKAFTLGEALMLQHDASVINTGLARVQAVNSADIQRVVKKYLVEGKAVVITYLDESKKPAAGGAK